MKGIKFCVVLEKEEKYRLHLVYGLVFGVWYLFRYASRVVYFYDNTNIDCLSSNKLCGYII